MTKKREKTLKNDEKEGTKQGNILDNRGKTMNNDAQERNKQEKK